MQLPEEFHAPLAALVKVAVSLGVMTPAWLVTPDEAVALQQPDERRGDNDSGWILLVEIPEEMWQALERLEAASVTHGAQVNPGPCGYRYMTFVIDVGSNQHRVNVPILGDSAMAWLNDLSNGKDMLIVLSSNQHDRTVEFELALSQWLIDEMTLGVAAPPTNFCEVMEDAAALTLGMVLAGQDSSAKANAAAKRFTASAVIPLEIEQRLPT